MLDKYFIKHLRDPLTKVAFLAVRAGITANQITILGFIIGMMSLPALLYQRYELALLFILLNRFMDGLDGAVARLKQPTDLGGYLDITLDFIFYSAVVFGFALADSSNNAIAAAFLIFSFMGTGSSFLAFAVMAEKREIRSLDYGSKSLFYLGGLAEGGETIGFYIFVCIFPSYFAIAAWLFGGICWLTTCTRLYAGYRTLK
ncbi:CDP-alcohol phosphatidyltransferase family protein [Marinomonas algicola]|uniref:CDP-alcohol phosphatidyltransferase family protein n=1 Tax=Marinomonas algicola TaxID=2773454 RepID=UPI00174B4AB1|nr:CDP-alcohol phosphatidyltransferase family protein [Marinomonas algicola]